MYEKSGKFYADWRDRTGARKRRSFKSARAALQFEAEQKEIAHPKRRAKGQLSPTSFSLSSLGTRRTSQTNGLPKLSLVRSAHSTRSNSGQVQSQKSMKRSAKARTRMEQK